jgi:hypothetical protein
MRRARKSLRHSVADLQAAALVLVCRLQPYRSHDQAVTPGFLKYLVKVSLGVSWTMKPQKQDKGTRFK